MTYILKKERQEKEKKEGEIMRVFYNSKERK